MEPSELSDEVLAAVQRAQERVGPGSIGAQQYHIPGQPQKFETITGADFLVMFQEEALDIINYGVMLSIRLDRMAKLWEAFVDEGSPDITSSDPGGDASNSVPPGTSSFVPAAELHGLLQDPESRMENP